MTTLADCFEIHNVSKEDRSRIRALILADFSGHKNAPVLALDKLIKDTEAERSSLVKNIESKGGIVPGTTDEPVKETVKKEDKKADPKITKQVEKLRKVAQSLKEKGNEKVNQDRLTNTPKRAREAGYAISDGNKMVSIGKTIDNIANAIEKGEAKHLGNITARTHVELLDTILRQAVNEAGRVAGVKYEERKGKPATEADIDHASYVVVHLGKPTLRIMANNLENITGGKRLANRLNKIADSLPEDGPRSRKSFSSDDDFALLVESNKKLGKKSPHYVKDSIDEVNRLRRIGANSEAELKSILKEYLQVKEGPKEIDPIKKMEMDLVGQNTGIDFFPTPKAKAKEIVDRAGIEKGMKVLEPSAGIGNLAEAMRDVGGDVDVAEISYAHRELLEAKGFNIVEHDFMDIKDGGYDRIVMNPPFSKNMDIEHVQKAYDLLKPGGKIVAIMGEGAFFRSGKKETAFREWLEGVGFSEKLPEKFFMDRKELNTTGVNARVVEIEKPEGLAEPKHVTKTDEQFRDTIKSSDPYRDKPPNIDEWETAALYADEALKKGIEYLPGLPRGTWYLDGKKVERSKIELNENRKRFLEDIGRHTMQINELPDLYSPKLAEKMALDYKKSEQPQWLQDEDYVRVRKNKVTYFTNGQDVVFVGIDIWARPVLRELSGSERKLRNEIREYYVSGAKGDQTSPARKDLSKSHLKKIDKIKKSRQYLDEVELDEWIDTILAGKSETLADLPHPRLINTILEELRSEGIVDLTEEVKFKNALNAAESKKGMEASFNTYIGKRVEEIKPDDLETLKEESGPKYRVMREWLMSNPDLRRTTKAAFEDEIAKLKSMMEPKLISTHEDYTLSESVVGELDNPKVGQSQVQYIGEPEDKIHHVRIDEVHGAKAQKVAKVQRVVEKAVTRLKDTEGKISAVRFVLPDGTEFTIPNNKKNLRNFKKTIQKVYTPIRTGPKKTPKTSLKPTARKKFDWGEKNIDLGNGWVTDSHMAIKGFKPPKRAKGEVLGSSPESLLTAFEGQMKNSDPAEIRYYATGNRGEDSEGKAIGKEPLLSVAEGKPGELLGEPSVIIRNTRNNNRLEFSQNKLNIIESVYPNPEYRIIKEGTLFALDDGEMVAVVMPRKAPEPHHKEMATAAGLYSMGDFAETPVIMELPEVVELANELLYGHNPKLVDKFRKMGVRGQFFPVGTGRIAILRSLGADFHQAIKTIAHEIGHLVDYRDEKTMARGNILGRIASLKRYMKTYLAEKPGAPGPLTDEDRKRLRSLARVIVQNDAKELVDEIIRKEIPVDPEDVLAILKGIEKDPEPAPEIVHFVFTASTPVKKSIAAQAMKGLSPKEMEHLKSYVDIKTGKKVAQAKPDEKAVAEKFKELLKEEVAKRNLFDKEVVMEELKIFTRFWRPFDPAMNRKYTAYRHSSTELYADAISGIIVNPQMVQRVAPTFWRGFFNYIDQKPETSQMWGEISERIGRGPVDVSMARLASDYDMFQRGHEIRAEKAKPKPIRGITDTLRLWLDDKNHFINKELREIEKAGGNTSIKARDARNDLHELPYIASEVEDFVYEWNNRIQKVMDEDGIHIDDLGVVALRKHIAANRKDIFSTKGYTPETAQQDLDVLKAKWGEEKFNKVNDLLDTLRDIRNDRVYPLMEESGLYTPELAKYMNETTDYSKVSVLHYLEEQFGQGTGARIYKQLGTLSDIENPVVATILQDFSIIRAARINISKRATAQLLFEAGVIEPARLTWDARIGGRVPKKPRNPDLGIFTVMVNGKPQHYYAGKHIIEAYEFNPTQANAVSRAWAMLSRPVRELLITKNPVWMVRNPYRDFRDTLKKNPEIKLRHSPRLLAEYKKALKEVVREVSRVERSDTISHLMRNRAITEDRIYDGLDYDMESEIQRIQNSFNLSTKADKDAAALVRVWRWFNSNANKAGRAMEIVSKVAGYNYLKKYTKLNDKEILNRVRGGRVGTPDFKTRGSLHTATNNIFMFSNINKEGIKTHIKAISENPGDYIWKTVATNIMPKVLLLGTVLLAKHLKDEHEDKALKDTWAEDVEVVARIIKGIPEYDMAHYTVIPLWLRDDGKSVYLRIPEDYEGQGLGAVAWKLMNGKMTGMGSVTSELTSMGAYGFHPLIGVAAKTGAYYGLGINPIDLYRGRRVLSDRAMDIGGKEAATQLAADAWRSIGGRILYDPKTDIVDRKRSVSEEVLKAFPGNVIGTFVRVSDRGISEKLFNSFRELDKQKSIESLKVDETLSKMSTIEKLAIANIDQKLRRRVKKMLLLEENTAYTRALAAATSKEKVAIVIDAMMNDKYLSLGGSEEGQNAKDKKDKSTRVRK